MLKAPSVRILHLESSNYYYLYKKFERTGGFAFFVISSASLTIELLGGLKYFTKGRVSINYCIF
jgi:hypothetical protein